jgi:hypothetical protein
MAVDIRGNGTQQAAVQGQSLEEDNGAEPGGRRLVG